MCTAFNYAHNENDLWFSYTANCDGPVAATTCGSDFDTKVTVYAACPTGPNQAIACNDDAGAMGACANSYQSYVAFDAAAGASYLIRVGGYKGAIGNGVLSISSECAPCIADFNQDGGVDGQDIDAFFNAWTAGATNADVNFDGGVDGGDVEVFFTTWQNGGC